MNTNVVWTDCVTSSDFLLVIGKFSLEIAKVMTKAGRSTQISLLLHVKQQKDDKKTGMAILNIFRQYVCAERRALYSCLFSFKKVRNKHVYYTLYSISLDNVHWTCRCGHTSIKVKLISKFSIFVFVSFSLCYKRCSIFTSKNSIDERLKQLCLKH